MKAILCISPDETFKIFQTEGGAFCCPVCGRADLPIAPYNEDGSASFQMCRCGFEFGFDYSLGASAEAVIGVRANWRRWRRKVIDNAAGSPETLSQLERQLANIRVGLAFDPIDVENEPIQKGDKPVKRTSGITADLLSVRKQTPLSTPSILVVKSGKGQHRTSFGVSFDLLAIGPASMSTQMHYRVGNVIPFHAHPNEQAGYILSGRVRVLTRDSESELGPGDSYAIPAGVEHSIVILTDAEELQVFSPPRADFL